MSDVQYKDLLLQHLVEEGVISDTQAADIVDEHERTGKMIRDIIVDMGILTRDEILEHVASLLGCEVINLMATDMPQSVIKSIPASVARMYNVIPVQADEQSVVLATSELLSPEVVDELTFVLTRDVSFVVAREDDIKSYLMKFYSDESDSVTDMLSALETELEGTEAMVEFGDQEGKVEELEHAANLTPVVRFVNLVLYQAVRDRASDIHFEPLRTSSRSATAWTARFMRWPRRPSTWPCRSPRASRCCPA